MNQANVSFAKIVATPTSTAWSQAYNAGSLFLVLAITQPESVDDTLSLTNIGKKIINNLEAEFFTLESKKLDKIKQALAVSLEEVPENVAVSLAMSFVSQQVLYVYVYGAGFIKIKRDDVFGTLIEQKEHNKNIISASGFIKQNDLILLETEQFSELIPADELKKALDLTLPSDIAETLSPHVHNSENGAAAAIVINITGVPAQENSSNSDNQIPEKEPENIDEKKPKATFSNIFKKLKLPRLNKVKHIRLPAANLIHEKKVIFLSIVGVFLLLLLAFGIIRTLNNRYNQQLENDFRKIYQEANNSYEEAVGIKTITPDRAQQLFTDADTLINNNINKFPDASSQKQKLSALQQKIKNEISQPSAVKSIKAEPVAQNDIPPILENIASKQNTTAAAEDKENIYLINKKEILRINKNTSNSKQLVTNDNSWVKAISLGTYLGNLYVLDIQRGLLKYVVASDGYGKTDYFQNADTPDLKNAAAMAIDGSVWLAYTDGKIEKYTKGQKEDFNTRIPHTLNSRAQLVTATDSDYLLLLDTGNSSLIKVPKDGTGLTVFQSSILKQAQAITQGSDGKTVYALSSNKVWKLTLE